MTDLAVNKIEIPVLYRQALFSYWNEDHKNSIEQIGAGLELCETNQQALFYKLWIEILADDSDSASLKELAEHLEQVSDTGHDDLYALIGICYLETDQLEAATLYSRSLVDSPGLYSKELIYRLSIRKENNYSDKHWYSSIENVTDYFHFKMICSEFDYKYDVEDLKRALRRQTTLYPKSPLVLYIEMQNFISSKDFENAFDVSAELVAKFPNNFDYSFNFAYCAFKAKYYTKAIDVLKELSSDSSVVDIDVISLLGHSLLEQYFATGKEGLSFEAKSILDRAVKLCKEQGFPATYPASQLARLYQRAEFKPSPSGKCWMVELSAKQFYWFRTAPLSEVSVLKKALGNQISKGDMVLFVKKDHISNSSSSTVKIGGLLSVVADAEWHPLEKFESVLRLENRPEIVIKFEVTEDQARVDPNNLDIGDARRYNALELTNEAQTYIDEVIEEYSEELGQFTSTYHELRTAR